MLKRTLVMTGATVLSALGIFSTVIYAAGAGVSIGDSSPEELFTGSLSSHYLLLSSNGVVSAWGDNTYGQCGEEPCDTVDDINYIDFENKVTKVLAGNDFSLALDENNIAWGWGNNIKFQLGIQSSAADGEQTNFSNPVKISENITDIAAGEDFSVLLNSDGELLFSGMGNADTLEVLELPQADDENSNIELIAAGYDNIIAVDEKNTVYWLKTDMEFSETAELPKDMNIEAAVVGRDHFVLKCSDRDNTYIYTCGDNSKSQLGTEGTEYSQTPVQILSLPHSEYEYVNIFAGKYNVTVDAWNNMSDSDPVTEYRWGTGCCDIDYSGECSEADAIPQPETMHPYRQLIAVGADKYMAFEYVNGGVMLYGTDSNSVRTIPMVETDDDPQTVFKYQYDNTEYQAYTVNFVKLNEDKFQEENKRYDETSGEYTDKYLLWEFVDEHHFRAKIKDFAVGTRKDVGIVRLSKAVTGENRSIACIGAEVWNFRIGNIMLTSDEQVIEYGHEDGTVIPIKVYKMSYRRQEEISLPSDTPVFYEEPGEITEETSLGLYIYGLPDGVGANVVWNESGDAEIRLSGNSSENIGGETRIKYSLIHIWNADEIQGKIGDYELENTMLNVASGSISGFKIYDVRYDIKSLRLLNENGEELSFVPNGGFIAEVCFNKAGDDGTKDTLIMAAYDPDGNLIYTDSVTAYFAEAYDHKFAFYVPAIYNNIDTIKVFVWDSFDSMIPMSDQEVKSNAVVS